MAIYFNQDYLDFFAELDKNNNREWFQANKKRYERSVKDPFTRFFTDLMASYEAGYGSVPMTPKQGLLRIYRDIRFSKDKTPYKIHMAGMISKSGKKDHSYPGIYVQANHVDVRIYSGCHGPSKEQLHAVRSAIARAGDRFRELIEDRKFKSVYGEIHGEKNKRLPSEFSEASEGEPLLFNKHFYYFSKRPPSILLEDGLVEKLMTDFAAADRVNAFFIDALGNSD